MYEIKILLSDLGMNISFRAYNCLSSAKKLCGKTHTYNYSYKQKKFVTNIVEQLEFCFSNKGKGILFMPILEPESEHKNGSFEQICIHLGSLNPYEENEKKHDTVCRVYYVCCATKIRNMGG